MATLTKYAGTISQTTGGKYAQFSNLANMKNNVGGSWATTANIKGKSGSPNRPSTLSFTNFGFNLPTGAEVSKVTITYSHRKTGSCTIGAPTISLLGVSGFSGKGVAPSKTTVTSNTKSFTGSALTRTVVNSSGFGVKVNYPANSGTGEGTISVAYVRITVEYKVPSYSLSIKKVSGGYNNERYTIQCAISNKNLTSYKPTLTLTAPTGFSFESASGSGGYTRVNARTITWNPQLSKSIGTASLDMEFSVNVTFPSGVDTYTGTFSLVESLYSGTKSFSATITERPPTPSDEGDTGEKGEYIDENSTKYKEILTVTEDEVFLLDIGLNSVDWDTEEVNMKVWADTGDWYSFYNETFDDNTDQWAAEKVQHRKKGQTNWTYVDILIEFEDLDSDGKLMFEFKCTDFNKIWYNPYKGGNTYNYGHYVIEFQSFDINTAEPTDTFHKFLRIQCNPVEDDLSTPFFTVLEPSTEEMNRLGSGYTYIAQSDINHNTTDNFVRDWHKNNRIGIFNNRIEPLFEDTTGDTSKYIYNSSCSVSSSNGEITVTWVSGTYVFWANKEGTSADAFDYSGDFTVEFDLTSTGNNSTIQIYDNLATSYYSKSLNNLSAMNSGHYKIVKTGQVLKTYVDGVEKTNHQVNSNITGACRVGFLMNSASTISFKNFVIYDNSIDIDNLSPQQIYENAEYWSQTTAGLNEYSNVECEFTYNENYPLYVLMTGDYPETTTYGYDIGTIKHNTPCIVEKQVYNGREASGNYPVPIEALLDNEEPSVITLSPNESTKGTVLYDLPLEDDFGTNEDYAIRGIQVRADIDSTDNLVIYAKIHSPSGEIGQRSIVLTGNEEEIVIGGLGDLWGFTTLQLTNLDDWELELSASNLINSGDSEIVFNNVNITFYLETVEKQEIRVTIDGEDIAYYGAFIEKVDIPEGLETDTSFLTIDGTDTNDAYRQNIREKKITIEFNLSNCDLQTSTNMLRQLTKLFTNEKDQYNRPIPKRLQFTHYPTDYFEYIMKEPFNVTTEITDYNVKATLTIPSGTSYSLDDTVTNTVGNANGLAAINPTILFQPSDSNIQIKETLSEQSFQMGYSGNWQDYTIELDCDDRRVYLIKDEDTKVDISKYVDHNSDWFRLSGEFEFEGINCTILTVTFNERW